VAREPACGSPPDVAPSTLGTLLPGGDTTVTSSVAPVPTSDEQMIVTAARALRDGAVCFVGIGLPSAAANLARLTHAPNLVLIYESGTIGAKPTILPLSIGDRELAGTADAVVSIPEIFAYWLQAGRIDIGFLSGAQLDKYANINSTVIGSYESPKTRLPGAGGAPEIAASAGAVMVIMRQSARAFVERCDFRTSIGYGEGRGDRERFGLRGGGPKWVITDLAVMEPDPDTCELVVVALHPGITREQVMGATGWTVRFADQLATTAEPTDSELDALRSLQAA
jgi:acyl CoA:acetate/3-ketoacid CoA transferase beta subunit